MSAAAPQPLPPEPVPLRTQQKSRALGLTSASALDELGHRAARPVGARGGEPGRVRQMAWFQHLSVVLKFLPLLFVGVVGWFFVSSANFGRFNASGGRLYSAIGIAAGVALFSFIGVEVAAVTAKRVRDPRRNVGRASVLGTAASAILYVLASAAVMGLVAYKGPVGIGTPFVPAFETIFGHSAWAGKLVAAIAATSGIGR